VKRSVLTEEGEKPEISMSGEGQSRTSLKALEGAVLNFFGRGRKLSGFINIRLLLSLREEREVH
jgi:hypothetical protein